MMLFVLINKITSQNHFWVLALRNDSSSTPTSVIIEHNNNLERPLILYSIESTQKLQKPIFWLRITNTASTRKYQAPF